MTIKPISLRKVQNFFVEQFFLFLPFNLALTFDIGFPFKLSEIALIIIFILDFKEKQFNFINFFFLKQKSLYLILILFLFFGFIAFVINLFWQYSYPLRYDLARINPLLDSLLKYFYFFIIFFAFIISQKSFRSNQKKYSLILLIGACIASIYSWYLFVTSIQNIEPFLLFGMDAWPQHALYSFGHFIRCGTFKEGNYMGFFLLVTAVVAINEKHYFIAFFLFTTIFITVSSMAICCSTIFLIIYITFKLIKAKQYYIIALGNISLFIAVFFLFHNEDFKYLIISKFPLEAVTAKLIDPSTVRIDAINSRNERNNSTKISWHIGLDNFMWGVGPANYYLHYDHYNKEPFYEQKEAKRISNNVYMEIFSELGIFCSVIFISFLYFLYNKISWDNNLVLKLGLVLSCIYLIAFPTFAILFLWTFYGYIYSVGEV